MSDSCQGEGKVQKIALTRGGGAAAALQAKHPLLCELMSCFASLLKEYKGEVEDILVADKQVRLGSSNAEAALMECRGLAWQQANYNVHVF
jgi:hypothetical protein